MKDLFTKVHIPVSEKKISYNDQILLLGSCFADNIGAKFGAHYFRSAINPFGTLYNPASIIEAINIAQSNNPNPMIVHHNGLWHSMMHHGCFSHPDQATLLHSCANSQQSLRDAMTESTVIIVTFGTSWIYKMDGLVVANCHKLPAQRFQRAALSVKEIHQMWLPLLSQTTNKHWIFTVSPIRHIKDGLHANHLSKATLLQAIDQLIADAQTLNPTSTFSYFPSYEIMLDELRDYRFYAEDMLHPSALAVDYIWQRFIDTYMTDQTQREMQTLHQLWRDQQHRFLHPDTPDAQKFADKLQQKKDALRNNYPWIE